MTDRLPELLDCKALMAELRVSLRTLRQLEEADREFVGLMLREGKFLELMSVEEGLAVEQAMQEIQRRLRDTKAEIAAMLATEENDG